VTAETREITENSRPITDGELKARLDHQDEILHAILHAVTALAKIATPEAVALLDKYVNNPAARWRRRNGGSE
jgi:hypothetical protein